MDTVSQFLLTLKSQTPDELKPTISQFEDFYDKKLWHQLTGILISFANQKSAAPLLLLVYSGFVKHWQSSMNKLSLVQFAAIAAVQCVDPKQSLAFLISIVDFLNSDKHSRDALVLARMEAAHYQLATGDSVACKATIDECKVIIDTELSGVDSTINACFYRVSADYYKAKAAYPQYYENALLFLKSVNQSSLPIKEQVERAHDLALSALMGEGLYNFGELLLNPILETLKKTPHEYLFRLISQFNSGDMDGFNQTKLLSEFNKQPLLSAAIPFLSQKLCVMTLIEVVFKRSKEVRGQISFIDIARECRVGIDEVEHLVMKAFSLGVVKGEVDEIKSLVHISWVLPRVLDKKQISSLKGILMDWRERVQQQVVDLKNVEGASDLFVN